MALLRTLFWFIMFLGATFVFTVLFEHGPMNFGANAEQEFKLLQGYVTGDVKRKSDVSDKVVP